jgi:hypothetical protein
MHLYVPVCMCMGIYVHVYVCMVCVCMYVHCVCVWDRAQVEKNNLGGGSALAPGIDEYKAV